jgi:phosphatidylethanolamine/phosphatidyl-N-methylethanolamine N-methyltransferase
MTMQANHREFFKALVRNPRRISALAPSSQSLAAAMIAQIPIDARRIIELGPGTGAFTQTMLESGISAEGIDLVELDRSLSAFLSVRFRGVRVHCARAEDIGTLFSGPVDAVVSGLPLLSFSEANQRAVLEGAFSLLRPSAPFIQFTYGLTVPVRARILRDLGVTGTRTSRTWRNLPPATVHVLRLGRI